VQKVRQFLTLNGRWTWKELVCVWIRSQWKHPINVTRTERLFCCVAVITCLKLSTHKIKKVIAWKFRGHFNFWGQNCISRHFNFAVWANMWILWHFNFAVQRKKIKQNNFNNFSYRNNELRRCLGENVDSWFFLTRNAKPWNFHAPKFCNKVDDGGGGK